MCDFTNIGNIILDKKMESCKNLLLTYFKDKADEEQIEESLKTSTTIFVYGVDNDNEYKVICCVNFTILISGIYMVGRR